MPYIPLTKGQVAQVDPEDFEWAKHYNWCSQPVRYKGNVTYYASRRAEGKLLLLHRCILSAKRGEEVDHWNGDTLDCRRGNLRLATSQQNSFNTRKQKRRTTSQYKGVCYVPKVNKTNPWIAYIGGSVSVRAKTPRRYLGYFSSEIAAALAYDTAARSLFGQFARLNFPI
jgi:hypothetical protein